MAEGLSDRERAFVEAYLVDFNGTRAARRAGYSERSAATTAHALLRKPNIQEALTKGRERILSGLRLEQDDVRRLWEIGATANRNGIGQLRRICCRFCYGENHEYQETPAEHRARRKEYDRLLEEVLKVASAGKPMKKVPDFDDLGGVGYDRRKPPSTDCPECFGDGELYTYIEDTRHLSPEALALYDGIDFKNGVPVVKTVSREKAAELLAKHLGMLERQPPEEGDRRTVYVDNDPDKPNAAVADPDRAPRIGVDE